MRESCQQKIDQIWGAIEVLEAKRALLSRHGLSTEEVSQEIVYQSQRVAWLTQCGQSTDEEISARIQHLEEQLGVDGLLVMRSSLTSGLPKQMTDWMSELALLRFARGDR